MAAASRLLQLAFPVLEGAAGKTGVLTERFLAFPTLSASPNLLSPKRRPLVLSHDVLFGWETHHHTNAGERKKQSSGRLPSFDRAELMGDVTFEEAYASESVYFGKTRFGQSIDFEAFTVNGSFQLNEIDMGSVCLKNAQLEAFRFTNCHWPKKNGHTYIAGHSNSAPGDLIDVYRRLKKIAKLDHDELRASEWHWQEKEMTYQSKSTDWIVQLFLCLYRLFSGYGEVPHRALGWLIAFLVLPLACFGVWTLFQTGITLTVDWGAVSDVGRDWYNSLPLTKMVSPSAQGTGKRALYLMFQILITAQASLFAFSLRNKLRR